MKYGKFLKEGSVYSVVTPKTPSIWSNYLFNDMYYMEVSQKLQGQSSRVDNFTRKPNIIDYRYFYVYNHDTKEVFNPNQAPLKGSYDAFECNHGLCFTELKTSNQGIKTEIKVFVPMEGSREIWRIQLRNESKESKKISFYSVFGFYDHGVMGGQCTYDKEQQIITKYAFPYHTLYEEKEIVEDEPSYQFMFSDQSPTSCDMSKRRFFGSDDITDLPAGIINEKCSGIDGEAEDFCGAMAHQFDIEPGESVSFYLVLGVASSKSEVIKLKEQLTIDEIEKEWHKTKVHWENVYNRFHIATPDKDLNYLVNHWLKKQVTLLTRQNRGTTYCPVRNRLQDAMGYAIIDPEGTIPFMTDVLALQNSNGFIQQWHFTDGTPPRGLCMLHHTDGPLWLIICVVSLIHQNGQIELLDYEVPYADGGSGTVYEHLYKAVKYMADNLGAHGLCLIGDGDWNDPINGVGREGRGESTWSTMALIHSINELLSLIKDDSVVDGLSSLISDDNIVNELQGIKAELAESINDNCWDGDWYVAGFDDNGVAYGSKEDSNRIFLNTQTWAIIAGVVKEEYSEKLQASIKSLDTPFGPRLLSKPFSEWDARWGRISVKKSGTTENGSVYCHASMFKAYADVVREDGEEVYNVIRQTLPTNVDNPPKNNLQLPTYIANYYYALEDSPNYGRSSMHYGTGTTAWMLLVAIEGLFGVKATVNGLIIKPCLPESWDITACYRKFKNARYKITFIKSEDKKIYVDGRVIEGNCLPYEENKYYEVQVNY